MKFTEEKIKVLQNLLSTYHFSTGFANHSDGNTYTPEGIIFPEKINLGTYSYGHSNIQLSPEGNLAIFPIIFDLFDAVIHKKLNKPYDTFQEKQKNIDKYHRYDPLIKHIEKETYRNATEIRNKFIHNDLNICTETKKIILRNKKEYPLSDFENINRLIFNLAIKLSDDKKYNLYEKNSAYTVFKKTFKDNRLENNNEEFDVKDLIEVSLHRRTVEDYSKSDIKENISLYNMLAKDMEYKDDNCKTKFHFGIPSNYTYIFKVGDSKIMVPAELIIKNKTLTTKDLIAWKI